mmetsp:Transcript_101315/g.254020  ORF Transcript_101315/g.254020 Transcript_101315/m.254020 type:complete len:341 (+) Transcript_101315:30-1052(+)
MDVYAGHSHSDVAARRRRAAVLAVALVACLRLHGGNTSGDAFSARGIQRRPHAISASPASAIESSSDSNRRGMLGALLASSLQVATVGILPTPAVAEAGPVFVAGATGNTGQRVVKELQRLGYTVVAGARNQEKAAKAFGSSVQSVPLDVEKFSVDAMAEALKGTKFLICATGFVPGNPFDMNKLAKAVDREGTIKLVDAAKKAGVQRFVLVSSILTNGRAIGQENNPGFVITNAFGGILDEKLVAEKYLKNSGLDYTILRPGGLKDKAPEGPAVIGKEDTLLSGEVSRDLVAKVAVSTLSKPAASRQTVELIEEGTCLGNVQKCEELPKGQADESIWFS